MFYELIPFVVASWCNALFFLYSILIKFKLLIVGRRRSSRLIASPWVHNWPKKPPAFVTIDDDGESCRTPGIVSGGTLLRKKVRGSVFGKSHAEGSTSTRMEIHTPRLEANRMMTRDQLEDDDAFVTSREQFSNSGRKETGKSGRNMGSYVLPRKARGQMASSGKKMQSQVRN